MEGPADPHSSTFQIVPSPNEAAGRPIVYSAVVDGIIHPVSAQYMMDTIEQADLAGAPESVGRVATRGEIWNAISSEPIPKGTRVRVTGVDRLTLVVRRD